MISGPPALALLAAVLLAGCDHRAIEQRTEQIQQHNEMLDRKFGARAVQIIREQWLVDGDFWYARLPDGRVVRLARPTLIVDALHQGRPFYTGWAGDVSIASATWDVRPAGDHHGVFSVKYRATFKDLKHGEWKITNGPKVQRAAPSEILPFSENP